MKSILIATAVIAVAGSAAAQAIHHPNGSTNATMTDTSHMTREEAAISSLEARWTAALIAKDLPALADLLAPKFQLVGIRSTGVTAVPRAQWLANAGSITFHDFTTETTAVQVFGDTALATVEGRWDIVFGGHPIKENFYVTDIWVRRDGAWRVVRRHSSPYQPAIAAPAAGPPISATDTARHAPNQAADAVFGAVMGMWEKGDLGMFDNLISRDYMGHVSTGDRDREGLRRRIIAFHQLYTAVQISVEDQIIDGDRVATRMLARGNSATGEPVELMGINIARVRDGKLQEEWNTWEPLKDPGKP